MSKVIGRNGWTDVDQANYEQGFDDAKNGEVELRNHPSYQKGYAMGKEFISLSSTDTILDTNVF